METKSVLELHNISKTYPSFSLMNMNISLKKGLITGFIGKNGAGKSTTLKIIMGLTKPDSGEVLYNGQNILCKKEVRSKQIGYIGDINGFYNDIYAKEITSMVKKAYGVNWDDKKYNHYIKDVFCIDENKKINELSTGMKMKYMISLELSKKAELLLLDEPTSGLDPFARDEVLDILYHLSKEEGKTIFFSSHITEDIEKVADRIIYIDNGQVILDESKSNIINNFVKISHDNLTKLSEIDQNKILSVGVLKNDFIYLDLSVNCIDINRTLLTSICLDEVLFTLKKGI